MSQDYFQCLVCSSLFGTLWKVQTHIKQHEANAQSGEGRRRGMLPIKKVIISDCFVPVVRNQIDPEFLKQYAEVKPNDEPGDDQESFRISGKKRGRPRKCKTVCVINDSEGVVKEEVKGPRKCRLVAGANIKRAVAALLGDSEEKSEDLDVDLSEVDTEAESDTEFRPPTYIRQGLETTRRKRGRPYGPTRTGTIATHSKCKRFRKSKRTEPGNHSCDHCSETFISNAALSNHLQNNHQDKFKLIPCPISECSKPCINFQVLHEHIGLHTRAEHREWKLIEAVKLSKNPSETTNENPKSIKSLITQFGIPCKFCLERFPSLDTLQTHINSHHSSPSILKCPCCPHLPPEPGIVLFLSHIKSLHPERIDPFNQRHQQREANHKNKVWNCDKCSDTFPNKYLLTKHLYHHTRLERQKNDPDRRFECPVCKLRFKYKDNLRRHFTLHLENNPFVCDFPNCNRKFNSDYNLRRHKALHYDSKIANNQKVQCPLCPTILSRKDKLAAHLRDVHKPGDITNPNPKSPQKTVHHRKKYLSRIQKCSRLRSFQTYKGLQVQTADLSGMPLLSPQIPSTENNPPIKTELFFSQEPGYSQLVLENEIHLTDKIYVNPNGSAVHIKGEQLTPEKLSTSLFSTCEPPVLDDSSEMPELTIQPTPLTKLITSDPIFEKLTSENPSQVKDILSKSYNYTDGRPFECHLCEAVFTRAWTLQLHLKALHNKSILDQEHQLPQNANKITIMCGMCAYPAKDSEDLDHHIKISHEKLQKCLKCGLFFKSQARLQQHCQEIHSGNPRKFKCNFCPSRFTKTSYLRIHQTRVHANSKEPPASKRRECPKCSKLLAPSAYYKHVKRHDEILSSEKKHVCMLCGDALSTANTLRRHIDAVHLGKPINKFKIKSQPGVKLLSPSERPAAKKKVRRGPKKPGDEWFQPILEKALGIPPEEEEETNYFNEAVVNKEQQDNELVSILGF